MSISIFRSLFKFMKLKRLPKNFTDYRYIDSLNFQSALRKNNNDSSLTLVLSNSSDPTLDPLEITFFGVSQLQIKDFGGGQPNRMCRLDITDISDRQYDGLYYYVFDYEMDKISFYCRDFSISE